MRFLLVLCSWPYYLRHTQQQSFVVYAPRDEQGRYLESYSRHSSYYRAAVASFITVLATIGLFIVGAVFVGLTIFQPTGTSAAGGDEAGDPATCDNPEVFLDEPTQNIACMPGGTFDMYMHWEGGTGCETYHSLFFTYRLPNNQYVDMDTSTTALTAGESGHWDDLYEDWPAAETITCQTAGEYLLTPRTEVPRYAALQKRVYVGLPIAPSGTYYTPATPYSLGFSWADNSNNELIFRIQRQSDVGFSGACDNYSNVTTKATNVTLYANGGLTPNTGYCYRVRSENGNGNSDYTSDLKVFTLPLAPNVTADRTATTWQATPNFSITNTAGWGVGGVRYYRYVWDTNPTHTWTGTESLWGQTESDCPPFNGNNGSCTSAGNTLSVTADTDSNSWYLHVRSYNYSGLNNGSQDIGPYYVDQTPPSAPAPVWDGDESTEKSWTNEVQGYAGSWTAVDDDTSGFSKYQYAIGTTPGGSDVVAWTDDGAITNIDNASVTLQDGQTYYLSVRAVDVAGNTSDVATSDGITVDIRAAVPSAIVDQPSRTSTTISWTTNEPATTQLEWGATGAYGNLTSESAEYTTEHEVTLTGLNENTTYYYRIRGKDRADNGTTGEGKTFTTTLLESTLITDTASEVLSPTSVRITWTTNHAATSRVRYGLTTDYGSEASSGALTTSHDLTLTNLTAGATYHYEVLSVGNTSTNDADATFTTWESTTIIGITAGSVSDSSAVISWTTNHGATSTVQYGITSDYGQESASSQLVTTHSLALTGLLSGTTYHYRVISVGYSSVVSSDRTFTTEPELISKVIPAVTPTLILPTADWSSIQTKPTITGLAKSGQTVLVYIDDALNGRIKATAHASGTGSFAYLPARDLKVGWHTIYLKAESSSGSISAPSIPVSFRVEQPYVAPHLFKAEVSNTTLPVVLLRGLAMNNSIIRVMVDNRTVDEFAVQNDPSGTANFSYQLSTDGQLAAGQHVVTLVAEDQNGRLSQATEPITFTKVASSASSQKIDSVEFSNPITYAVQSGDSLWRIAQKLLGDGSRYDEIVALNLEGYPQLYDSPGLILPGWKLALPAAPI